MNTDFILTAYSGEKIVYSHRFNQSEHAAPGYADNLAHRAVHDEARELMKTGFVSCPITRGAFSNTWESVRFDRIVVEEVRS